MIKKYLVFSLAIILTLSIGLMADLGDRQENQPSDLTSPKVAQADQTAWKGGDSRAVVWDNGMAYVGILTAQQEAIPDGLDSEPADDFMFASDQLVNDVHWIGGYWNGPPDDGDFDWIVRFYGDDGTGTQPGALIGTYPYPNANVNETWLSGSPGAANFYSYSVNLPATLTFLAGTKYWISIQGQGNTSPQSGWAYHEDPDILLHEAVIRSVYFGIPNWTNTSAALGYPVGMCFQLTYEEQEECQWNPGDPHKMHYAQLPDEAGWDVNATQPMILADDFMCMQDGPITDIHFWGSWRNGIEGQIVAFWFSIHEDIPADQNPAGYSMPGATLWEREVNDFGATPKDPPSMEGWYDPATGEELWNDHQAYFQYDVCFDPTDPDLFIQDSGTIYWLNISVVVADPIGTQWGWKSTQDHWNDDAVWSFWGELDWIDIWEPTQPLANAWGVTIDPQGTFLGGYGEDHYGEGWYYYPMYDWWNVWFYDHPFAPERLKRGFIEFDVFPLAPGPMWIELAVNWSTDAWSLDQPPGDSAPPLPGVPEDLYIGREVLFAADFWEGHVGPLPYEILDYNPEWVSVDVRGFNFDIPVGIIEHTCQGSLDLAFVITGPDIVEDSGACCYDPTGGPPAQCIYTTQTHCEQILGGVYQGDGVLCAGDEACCLPDGSCVMADALCCVNELGGVPQGAGSVCTVPEACCFPDNTCWMLDPLCCDDQGGTPQGLGSVCLGMEACCMADGSCVMADAVCCLNELGGIPQGPGTVCTTVQACCLQDGSCTMADPLCCDDLGGTPQGAGTVCTSPVACCLPDNTCINVDPLCCDEMGGTLSPFGAPACLGDGNGNGVDDACEQPEGLKWRQEPDLEPTGLDVAATCPGMFGECIVTADDFLCEQTGAIYEIVVYGSWLWEEYPAGDPGLVSFKLSLHSDVPAGIDQPWSHPGELLWLHEFHPGQFMYEPYAMDIQEGYYDPFGQWYEPYTDFICWKYTFPIQDPDSQFIQQGTETEPVIYWLDVQAMPEAESWFGWKTSIDHWNDDAVWSPGFEPVDPMMWMELRYIPPHPWTGESIDLAFEIWGEDAPCDCIPGDANGDGAVNVGDAVYIIAYVFKGGPPPVPYRICSGDANCDCAVNVGDAVYVISYVFKGGPAPCDCPTWLLICGPPLRK
jgi:hypothetical protein